MAFSEATKEAALAKAGYRCECARSSHAHTGRCASSVTKSTSECHHKTAVASGGDDTVSNCEVLCKPCHALIPKPS